MKIESSPGSLGFLAGALVLLLGVLANASCAHTPAPKKDALEVVLPVRTVMQRAETAVEVFTECGSGSGVLLNDLQVLTAFHVINCDDFPAVRTAQYIVIRTFDKKASRAKLEIGDGGRDLARLVLSTPIEDVVPVSIRDARPDEIVCAATAVPERAFRCGYVKGFAGPRLYGDVVVRGMNIWYGNSGSGVYAEDGSLIGIAVRLHWCTDGDALLNALIDIRVDTCGGRISSISDSPVKP